MHHAVNWRSQFSFYNYVFSLQACRKHRLLLAAHQKENILVFKGSYFLSLSHDFTSLTSEFWMLNFGNIFLAMQMKKSIIMQQKELHYLLLCILLVLYLAWVTSIQSMPVFIWVWQEVPQHKGRRRCGSSGSINKIFFCYHYWLNKCETGHGISVVKDNRLHRTTGCTHFIFIFPFSYWLKQVTEEENTCKIIKFQILTRLLLPVNKTLLLFHMDYTILFIYTFSCTRELLRFIGGLFAASCASLPVFKPAYIAVMPFFAFTVFQKFSWEGW